MTYTVNEYGSIDRGENPKNPGDRGFGHGDQITMKFDPPVGAPEEVEAGMYVNFDGEGGVYRPEDLETALNYDAVLKNDAMAGELVTVHVRGAIRAGEYAAHGVDDEPDPSEDSAWPVITELDDDDFLVALR